MTMKVKMADIAAIAEQAPNKCSKTRKGKWFFKVPTADDARVIVSVDDEYEFKLRLQRYFSDADTGKRMSDARLAQAGKVVWNAYKRHRYSQEMQDGLEPPREVFPDGTSIKTPHAEYDKERRTRRFFIATGMPKDLEIRQEIKDGEVITMIKKGNGATVENPAIKRIEVKLKYDASVDIPIEELLAGLPRDIKNLLELDCSQIENIFPGVELNSHRYKTLVQSWIQSQAGPLLVKYEPAHDVVNGVNIIGQRRMFCEFEGEVKGIYADTDSKVDLKEHPDHVGLTDQDIDVISQDFLRDESNAFQVFATDFLHDKAVAHPDRYRALEIAPVFTSKSHDLKEDMKPALVTQSDILQEAITAARNGDFVPNPALAA